jgi:hypothetical protein
MNSFIWRRLYAGRNWKTSGMSAIARKVTPAGIISTVAGNGIKGFSGDAGPATEAQLALPNSIAVDSAGNSNACFYESFSFNRQ